MPTRGLGYAMQVARHHHDDVDELQAVRTLKYPSPQADSHKDVCMCVSGLTSTDPPTIRERMIAPLLLCAAVAVNGIARFMSAVGGCCGVNQCQKGRNSCSSDNHLIIVQGLTLTPDSEKTKHTPQDRR